MRPRKNMLKAGITALVYYFANNDARHQADVGSILKDAFDWDADQVDEKLDNYMARYNRLEDVYSVVSKSRSEIADAMELNSDMISDCIDILKESGYVTQYGGGYGKVLIMTGTEIDLPDLDDFTIRLIRNADEPAAQARPLNVEFDPENMTLQEILLGVAEQFKGLANALDGFDQVNAEELEEQKQLAEQLQEENQRLIKELDIVKRTSWR